MPIQLAQPQLRIHIREGVAVVGRHGAMSAAQPDPSDDQPDPVLAAHDADSLNDHGPQHARNRQVIDDPERFAYLTSFSIKKPASAYRDAAVEEAARLWLCTERKSAKRDEDALKFLANYLYSNGLYWGNVDPRRAMRRAAVDAWIEDGNFAATSARTYRAVLYQAGRVLYPSEYPRPLDKTAPRARPTAPASPELVRELYGIAAGLPQGSRLRLQFILDLTTQAGLRAPEILDLRGSDITPLILHSGETVAVVRIHRRGVVDRLFPVVCPIRSKRLLDRARDVGRGHMLPTPAGGRPEKYTIGNTFSYLKERGFPVTTVNALRNRWLVDMAATTLPTAALARLCGPSLFRSLAYQMDELPIYEADELAAMLAAARRTR